MRGLLALAVALTACACTGYSSERLTDFPQARSIAVLPIENAGFRRDLELRLSQALARELRARTSLAPATASTADLVLAGRMDAGELPAAIDEEGRIVQQRLSGWLELEVRERASGRVLRRARVRTLEEFRPGVDGESLAGFATDAWVRRLAERAVQALERPISTPGALQR